MKYSDYVCAALSLDPSQEFCLNRGMNVLSKDTKY